METWGNERIEGNKGRQSEWTEHGSVCSIERGMVEYIQSTMCQNQVGEGKQKTLNISHERMETIGNWEEELAQAFNKDEGGQEECSDIREIALGKKDDRHIRAEGYQIRQREGRHTRQEYHDNEMDGDGQHGNDGDEGERNLEMVRERVRWWDVH